MKKIYLSLFIPLLFARSAEIQAEEWSTEDCCCSCCVDMPNIYAKIFGGANFLQNSFIKGNKASYHTGYIFGGSLGYAWCYGLHWEAEYAFRRNAIDKIHFFTQGNGSHGHIQTSSYMANMLWYVPLCSWGYGSGNLRPLIGAGIGYDFEQMRAKNSRVAFHQKWHKFSWQAIAGLAYTFFCNTELTLEYKFHQGGHFYNHAVGVGLAYRFDLN